MKLHLAPLLFALLLFVAAACSPKKGPAPALEGTWQLQYTETTSYNADGSVQRHSPSDLPIEPTTYTFTPSEFTLSLGSRAFAYTYTREEAIIHSHHAASGNSIDLFIAALTKSELVLEQASGHASGGGYTYSIMHLSR